MKKIAILLSLLAVSNLVFAANVSISPVKVSYNNISSDENGNLIQTVYSDNGMAVSMSASIEDENIKYTLRLDNISDPNYLLRSDCIKTYYGNFEKDEWHENTSSAFSNKQTKNAIANSDSELSAAEVCVVAGATCLCALTLFEICQAINGGSSSSSSTRVSASSNKVARVPSTPAVKPKRSTTIITPPPTFNWIFIDTPSYSSSSSSSNRTIEQYNNVPGLTQTVATGGSYYGTFYVPCGKGPDYRVRFIVSKNEYIDFYFSRSDRDSVANPLKDRNYGRHSVLVSACIPDFNRFGGYYIYSGKTIGAYVGINAESGNWNGELAAYTTENSFNHLIVENFVPFPSGEAQGNCNYYLDVATIDYTKCYTDVFDLSVGLTIKTISHTWLMIGCGFDFAINTYYGDIWGKNLNVEPEKLYTGNVQDTNLIFGVAPQIGVNVIFDHLSLAATYQYSFINKSNSFRDASKFDIMLGIAL